LNQILLLNLVNHPKGPRWATDTLEQDLRRVPGPAGTGHWFWRREWRGGIVYHIYCMHFPGKLDPRSGWLNGPYLGPSVDLDGARECCLGPNDNVVWE